MRRAILVTSLLAGVVAFGAMPAQAGVSADINIHVGNRGPVFYSREPRAYVIPSTEVYYVEGSDYDTYRYGRDWYVNQGGEWYCSTSSWRGPFIRVAFERVPRVILQVPGRYHRQSRGYWQGQGSYRHDGAQRNNGGQWNGQNRNGGDRRGQNDGQWNNGDRRGQNDGQWNNGDRRGQNDGQWNNGDRRGRNDGQWNNGDQGKGHGRSKKTHPGRGNGRGNGNYEGRGGA